MREEILTIALAKGRLGDEALMLLERAGLDVNLSDFSSRQLIIDNKSKSLRFFMAKPSDVPTYVEYGAADIGFVGKDSLLEENRELYEVLDLGFGACRLCVCGKEELKENMHKLSHKRVATKYPAITRQYFEDVLRESVEIIKLTGSVELAPLIGLSDVIVDIVESGRTLKENNLVVLEEIAKISARLVINRVSMKMKAKQIQNFIERVRGGLE